MHLAKYIQYRICGLSLQLLSVYTVMQACGDLEKD